MLKMGIFGRKISLKNVILMRQYVAIFPTVHCCEETTTQQTSFLVIYFISPHWEKSKHNGALKNRIFAPESQKVITNLCPIGSTRAAGPSAPGRA